MCEEAQNTTFVQGMNLWHVLQVPLDSTARQGPWASQACFCEVLSKLRIELPAHARPANMPVHGSCGIRSGVGYLWGMPDWHDWMPPDMQRQEWYQTV